MKTESKISTKEIVIRLTLFLIFSTSAILKLVVGFENFELGIVASGELNSWLESIYICNSVVILEVSCAIMVLFGKVNNFQKGLFTFIWIFYSTSILGNMYAPFFQEYTLLYLGSYIINILGALTIIIIISFSHIIFIFDKPLLKWHFQISLILIGSTAYILLGSLNTNQFKDKTEFYHSGISDWTPFIQALDEKYPEISKDRNILIAFFSVGCSHCQQFAKKISLSPSKISKTNVVYVFWAEENEIEQFMAENGVIGPYLKLPQNVIMSIVGPQFPMFYEYSNGQPKMEYSGTEFSYVVMDRIFGN